MGPIFHKNLHFSRKSKPNEDGWFWLGETPWSCLVCGKAFRRKEHLTIHNRIHTGMVTHFTWKLNFLGGKTEREFECIGSWSMKKIDTGLAENRHQLSEVCWGVLLKCSTRGNTVELHCVRQGFQKKRAPHNSRPDSHRYIFHGGILRTGIVSIYSSHYRLFVIDFLLSTDFEKWDHLFRIVTLRCWAVWPGVSTVFSCSGFRLFLYSVGSTLFLLFVSNPFGWECCSKTFHFALLFLFSVLCHKRVTNSQPFQFFIEWYVFTSSRSCCLDTR